MWVLTALGVPQALLKRVRLLMSGEKRRARPVKDGYQGACEAFYLYACVCKLTVGYRIGFIN